MDRTIDMDRTHLIELTVWLLEMRKSFNFINVYTIHYCVHVFKITRVYMITTVLLDFRFVLTCCILGVCVHFIFVLPYSGVIKNANNNCCNH